MELALGNIDVPNIPPTLITRNVSEGKHARKGVSLFAQWTLSTRWNEQFAFPSQNFNIWKTLPAIEYYL